MGGIGLDDLLNHPYGQHDNNLYLGSSDFLVSFFFKH